MESFIKVFFRLKDGMDKSILEQKLNAHLAWLKGEGGERANLSGNALYGVNLSGVDLSKANLYEAKLRGANLSGTNLSRANLCGANLDGANLSGANLSLANLSLAKLSVTDFSGANLDGTNLSGADLCGANLSGTLLDGKAILSFQFEKHTAYFYGTDEIRIGCYINTVKEWLETFEEIGKKENYSPKQIEMYGNFIKQCNAILNSEG